MDYEECMQSTFLTLYDSANESNAVDGHKLYRLWLLAAIIMKYQFILINYIILSFSWSVLWVFS